MFRSEWAWVSSPEVAQHRHVVLVFDAHCDLMDLGAQLPVRDVLQRHGHLEKADLVIGVSCQDRRSMSEASML